MQTLRCRILIAGVHSSILIRKIFYNHARTVKPLNTRYPLMSTVMLSLLQFDNPIQRAHLYTIEEVLGRYGC
jgi:hypothetical protein